MPTALLLIKATEGNSKQLPALVGVLHVITSLPPFIWYILATFVQHQVWNNLERS